MSTPADDPTATAPDAPAPERQALQQALAGLLDSVAQLGVARGMPVAEVEELLRQAYVRRAAEAHPGLPEHRKVSRISTTTGLHRREVARLVQLLAEPAADAPRPRARSLASEVFTHWRTQPPFRGADGEPCVLPRLGPAPSFETLAQAVTRNVHARSLLDELCRLGVARWDAVSDSVAVVRDGFVPGNDEAQSLAFLGDNVGDHLRAAVQNVLGGEQRQHFEQAVFASGLSAAAIASVRPVVRAQWQALLQALVPMLEAHVERDGALDPPPQGRLRVGLYTYQEGAPAEAPAPPREPVRARARRKG
jgi:hypothetical protein